MARPLRLEFPGALYHLTSRGNARLPICEDDEDREGFLATLSAAIERFNWICHAYCLMGNHYHLMVETPDGNVSAGMRHLNGVYTQRFNRRHDRVGHVFQGRFKAIVVERESYLLELCRYVVLNPVRAGMVKRVERYPWSSYRATVGLEAAPAWLTTDWVLGQFGRQRRRAQGRYAQFVQAGRGETSPWAGLRSQVLLGDDRFIERLAPRLREQAEVEEIPRRQRFGSRPPLEALFRAKDAWSKPERDAAFRNAYFEHGYKLAEIARVAGVHYTTVSKVINQS